VSLIATPVLAVAIRLETGRILLNIYISECLACRLRGAGEWDVGPIISLLCTCVILILACGGGYANRGTRLMMHLLRIYAIR
jgi:hypothetical protein